jgi:hypothetical protein
MISPKNAFAGAVDRLKRCLDSDGDAWSAGLDRLTTDLRMRPLWEGFNGDERTIERFLSALVKSVETAACADINRELYDHLSFELDEVTSAIDVLLRYCGRRKSDKYRPADLAPAQFSQQFGNLESILHELADDARSYADLERALIAGKLHTSRKSGPEFSRRVHLPLLLSEQMWLLFGKPHYDLVAETLNVFLDLTEEDSMTADNVRDAWRRHGRVDRMKRAIQATKPPPIARARAGDSV